MFASRRTFPAIMRSPIINSHVSVPLSCCCCYYYEYKYDYTEHYYYYYDYCSLKWTQSWSAGARDSVSAEVGSKTVSFNLSTLSHGVTEMS